MAASAKCLSRLQGSLVGAVVGDCLGAPFEGSETVTIASLKKFFDKVKLQGAKHAVQRHSFLISPSKTQLTTRAKIHMYCVFWCTICIHLPLNTRCKSDMLQITIDSFVYTSGHCRRWRSRMEVKIMAGSLLVHCKIAYFYSMTAEKTRRITSKFSDNEKDTFICIM